MNQQQIAQLMNMTPDRTIWDISTAVAIQTEAWADGKSTEPTKEEVNAYAARLLVTALVGHVSTMCVNYPDPVDVISEKAAYWFSILAKCATALNLPDDEPIPTGVLNGVKATQNALEAAKKRLLQITYEGPIDSVSTASKGLFEIDQALNKG